MDLPDWHIARCQRPVKYYRYFMQFTTVSQNFVTKISLPTGHYKYHNNMYCSHWICDYKCNEEVTDGQHICPEDIVLVCGY